jgi:hypothetical protein
MCAPCCRLPLRSSYLSDHSPTRCTAHPSSTRPHAHSFHFAQQWLLPKLKNLYFAAFSQAVGNPDLGQFGPLLRTLGHVFPDLQGPMMRMLAEVYLPGKHISPVVATTVDALQCAFPSSSSVPAAVADAAAPTTTSA